MECSNYWLEWWAFLKVWSAVVGAIVVVAVVVLSERVRAKDLRRRMEP